MPCSVTSFLRCPQPKPPPDIARICCVISINIGSPPLKKVHGRRPRNIFCHREAIPIELRNWSHSSSIKASKLKGPKTRFPIPRRAITMRISFAPGLFPRARIWFRWLSQPNVWPRRCLQNTSRWTGNLCKNNGVAIRSDFETKFMMSPAGRCRCCSMSRFMLRKPRRVVGLRCSRNRHPSKVRFKVGRRNWLISFRGKPIPRPGHWGSYSVKIFACLALKKP